MPGLLVDVHAGLCSPETRTETGTGESHQATPGSWGITGVSSSHNTSDRYWISKADWKSDNSERPLTPTNSSGASPSTPDTLECYRPSSKSYGDLVPRCVELYYEHIYPIMPLLYKPDIEQMLQRPLRPHEQTLLYALSAKTCFHMRGQGLQATGPDSWERAGRFFLDECEASRKTYDYIKEISLFSVISSFWMSTSSFEIKDDWKSAFYLKEALAFALELRLDNESSYSSLSLPEDICHRRTFWQLFVTERLVPDQGGYFPISHF